MERDPVCGMQVDPKSADTSAEYQNKTYYFCGSGCRTRFQADPTLYLES